MDKIEPFLPIQHRPPNKFLRNEVNDFDDGHGNGGKIRIAYFLDKKGKEQSVTAQVMWEYGWYVGRTKEEAEKAKESTSN